MFCLFTFQLLFCFVVLQRNKQRFPLICFAYALIKTITVLNVFVINCVNTGCSCVFVSFSLYNLASLELRENLLTYLPE